MGFENMTNVTSRKFQLFILLAEKVKKLSRAELPEKQAK